jgi:hypothetical protein
LTTSTSTQMDFPPNLTEQEEIRPWGQNDRPSKSVKRVGEGVSSGEPIDFQQDKEITHVNSRSLTMVLLIR